jgi:hypothetical protein
LPENQFGSTLGLDGIFLRNPGRRNTEPEEVEGGKARRGKAAGSINFHPADLPAVPSLEPTNSQLIFLFCLPRGAFPGIPCLVYSCRGYLTSSFPAAISDSREDRDAI